jgi:hypothetical protein
MKLFWLYDVERDQDYLVRAYTMSAARTKFLREYLGTGYNLNYRLSLMEVAFENDVANVAAHQHAGSDKTTDFPQ